MKRIEANDVSLGDWLEVSKNQRISKIVIPDFQRAYAWKDAQVIQLLDDLEGFFSTKGKDDTYFLGSLVTYGGYNDEECIVDGQQRLTTIFLALTAIYKYIDELEPDNVVHEKYLGAIKTRLGDILWYKNPKTHEYDRNYPRFDSQVIEDEGKTILKSILSLGDFDLKSKDPYVKNYKVLVNYYKKYFSEQTIDFISDYVYNLLDSVCIVTIRNYDLEYSIKIYGTINYRGVDLGKADVYKASIYHNLDLNERDQFIKDWDYYNKELSDLPEVSSKKGINVIINFCEALVKAEGYDTNTNKDWTYRKIGKVNFDALYIDLYRKGVFSLIVEVAKVIYKRANTDIRWLNNPEILVKLDILKDTMLGDHFINLLLGIYSNQHNSDFEDWLSKYIDLMLLYYIRNSLTNDTIKKTAISKIGIMAVHRDADYGIRNNLDIDHNLVSRYIKETLRSGSKRVRAQFMVILKLIEYYSYDRDDLLPLDLTLEHIFPVKWERNYLTDRLSSSIYDDKVVANVKESIGNLVLLENKINIVASNNYFVYKKIQYSQSDVLQARELSLHPEDDWFIPNIYARQELLITKFMHALSKLDPL